MKKKKTKQNNNDFIIMSIMVLIIVIVCLVFGIRSKNIKIEYDENEIKSYYSKFGYCAFGYKLDFKNNNIKYEDLPRVFINNTLYNYLKYNNKVSINEEKESFNKEDLDNAIKNIYGEVKYEFNDTLDLGDYSFKYDEDENVYKTTKSKEINCEKKLLNGYVVNSVEEVNNKLYLDVLYYDYDLEFNGNTCLRYNFYGTKDNETFRYGSPENLKFIPEHFLTYRFVFKPYNESYIFDYVEVIK